MIIGLVHSSLSLNRSKAMNKITQYFLSPNVWVGIFSILAIAGILLCAVGFAASNHQLIIVGLWLITPILLGSVVIFSVVVPFPDCHE